MSHNGPQEAVGAGRRARGAEDEMESWLNRTVKQPVEAGYRKYILELLLRQFPLPPSRDGRHIPLRTLHEPPLVDERRGHAYISNTIRSSRYTLWDFLPKQLLFQATRLSNFYFICIGVPQTIPGLSTTGNYSTILPLCFFILLTVVKEGYDDFKRHRMDKVENRQPATVLRRKGHAGHARGVPLTTSWSFSSLSRLSKATAIPRISEEAEQDFDEELEWISTRWRDVKVGDIVRLKRDEHVPADLVLLYASGENGIAYVETMALDGETNLKSKQAPVLLRGCSSLSGIKSCQAEVVSEDPNRNLYGFNGRVTIHGSTSPLTLNEVLFRGSVLRNTSYAIGIVVNTGEECKIRMNANHHPKAKKPRLERYANQVVLTLIVYVVLLSVGLSMGYIMWHQDVEVNAWYLNNSYVSFKEIIVGFLIMFNNVIPLALYVSLEIMKIGQMLMISSDVEMYDEASNVPMTCNTNTILENLGQVSYILSDKTGTLTENVMKFRKLSIAGVALTHHSRVEAGEEKGTDNKHSTAEPTAVHPSGQDGDEKKSSITVQGREVSGAQTPAYETARPSLTHTRSSNYHNDNSEPSSVQMLEYIRRSPSSAFSKKAKDFVLGMALCHTALPEMNKHGKIAFEASSPDELALLEAARDLGLLMIQRSSQSITLLETGITGTETRHTYEILDVIEFSSKRKRMSILVRCPDDRIWLLCKGADSVIMPRLQQAGLASRKSREVHRSIQLGREQQRRSESMGPRNSFGARPSLTVRRKNSMEIRMDPKRTTLDVPKPSHEIRVNTRSFDATRHRPSGIFDSPALSDDAAVFSHCFRHLDDFATEGLRTLLFAQKTVSQEDYLGWKKLYQDASTALIDRQSRIEAAAEMIEQGLDLLGASAIEDRLQSGVSETIDKLRRANMKIWMLTGDKRETAINIAHAARICKPESEVWTLDVTKGDLSAQLSETASEILMEHGRHHHTVLVIDGHTLAAVEGDAPLKQKFYSLISYVDSVICCRASPSQKAGIVKAIRARIPSALTLAIGDGANDIAMIQSAHVGVGISGKEGLQAARVADYSIAQFRFLQRLLLVHGRWNYVRTAKFVLWTFWKEMFFYMMQALYQNRNGYTGASLYENWSLTVLNTLFTSLCVIVPGILEQDLKAETLLAIPELYVYGQRNMGLNLPKYIAWMVLATVEGMIVWWVSYAAFGVFNVMGDNGVFALGDLCFSLGIVWTNYKLLILETHCKTIIVGAAFTITVGGWWAWNGFMSAVYGSNLSPYDVKGGFSSTFGNDANWWASIFVAFGILLVMEVVYKSLKGYLRIGGLWPFWKRGSRRQMAEGPGRSAEEIDVGLWQEMERDPVIAEMLKRINAREKLEEEFGEEEIGGCGGKE
ncbi:putative phospholipid-transporting ATPase DNF3 [Teratosphaeria destructans]|uniref:Phospholipid-transporting ATPase n=1 Tax=Teratosphaeria destructans TaxID=418781 RepID=A0A9W7SKD5_9PEZI|nr:putative phospholipid-transporting ATPase DNF3 [Teratosphaeria destructans]